jgi:uncharacterized protein with NRDE domain
MCTLIVSYYPQTKQPLIIGANRDESPTRPSKDWDFRNDDYIYCPLDVRDGTWIGVNKNALFCAITNWDLKLHLHGKKSRGLIVLDILKSSNMKEVIDYWRTLRPDEYKPFNIIVGTSNELYHLSNDNEMMYFRRLPAGLYISTGWGLGGVVDKTTREIHIESYLMKRFNRNINFNQPVTTDSIMSVLSHHNDGVGSQHSICVHDTDHRWETRSSAVISLVENIDTGYRSWSVYKTDKAPCLVSSDEWKRQDIRCFEESSL